MIQWLKKIFQPNYTGRYIITEKGIVLRIEEQSSSGLTFNCSKGSFYLENGKIQWKVSKSPLITLSRNNFRFISELNAEKLMIKYMTSK